MIDTDLKEIDTVVESCERLFSSPIPPNMARHGMRSLTLWLLALPIVLTNSMPPLLVALWTMSTSYIYLGGARAPRDFQSVAPPCSLFSRLQSRRAHDATRLTHSCSPALMLSRPHALTHSCSPALMLSRTHALPPSCSHGIMLSRTHALPPSCSPALMLSRPHALMASCSHGLMLSRPRALTPSCSHGIMLSRTHALMASCSHGLVCLHS